MDLAVAVPLRMELLAAAVNGVKRGAGAICVSSPEQVHRPGQLKHQSGVLVPSPGRGGKCYRGADGGQRRLEVAAVSLDLGVEESGAVGPPHLGLARQRVAKGERCVCVCV